MAALTKQDLLEALAGTEGRIRKDMATKADVTRVEDKVERIAGRVERIEGNVERMEGTMATHHDVEVLERKIEQSEINVKAAMFKQRLELDASVNRHTDELAIILKRQVDEMDQRLLAVEQV